MDMGFANYAESNMLKLLTLLKDGSGSSWNQNCLSLYILYLDIKEL